MNTHIQDLEINKFLDESFEKIQAIYHPKELWFFGSRITGNAKEESDVDLVIVSDYFQKMKWIYRTGDFLKKIDFSRHVDALCYTPQEFEKKKNEIGIIRDEVLGRGVKVI